MRLQHVAAQIYTRPWLITPGGHASVRRLFEAKLAAPVPRAHPPGDEEAGESFWACARRAPHLDEHGIGHIHVLGVIGHHLSGLEKSCGCTDVDDVRCEVEEMVGAGARAILLDVDSPGGTVTGVPELADFLAEVDQSLPVYGFVDSLSASAGYWTLSSVRVIGCTPSAELGSIGVYMPWIDASGAWAEAGLKADPIVNSGGTFKAAGFGPSLTDEQRAQLQAQVDRVFGLFKGFVSAHRALAGATVPDASMQGQTFLGVDAVAAGLADVVGSREEFREMIVADLDAPAEPAPLAP